MKNNYKLKQTLGQHLRMSATMRRSITVFTFGMITIIIYVMLFTKKEEASAHSVRYINVEGTNMKLFAKQSAENTFDVKEIKVVSGMEAKNLPCAREINETK